VLPGSATDPDASQTPCPRCFHPVSQLLADDSVRVRARPNLIAFAIAKGVPILLIFRSWSEASFGHPLLVRLGDEIATGS
jgi:hypothetical protein